ncbi:glycerol dehydrogenase [Fistulina hepatica ATCC 64428]|uniref:Glycerol dehydrogenase n=1 Tax=Fistulina hepatica ATCC 64428 TaxID=1128425 RepID=A0A0D7A3W9_9AGAR|nr:glycerol dehydrogenase [Fistulina hepatica ATCC 64428]
MPNKNNVTESLFQSPSKYIQGPNAIKNAGKYLAPLGKKAILISDDLVHKLAGVSLIEALVASDFDVQRVAFNGEASAQEIARIGAIGQQHGSQFVIALGGGKTIDTAKAVADRIGVDVAVLPTTASTDAPCSALSVIYTPNGEFERYSFFNKNPTIVLVDTTTVAKAPARFLASGMGDALATNVEARRVGSSPNFGGGLPTQVSSAICAKCEEILFTYGAQAYEACKANVVTPALEAVVEANTLHSGLGFESGGLAAAHAIHDGMTAIHELHNLLHGEKVAFGIVCQLILDKAPTAELDRYIAFMLSVDLPVTFELLGIPNVKEKELRQVAALACAPEETIWTLDIVISPEIVYNAIVGADAASRDYIRRSGWKKPTA